MRAQPAPVVTSDGSDTRAVPPGITDPAGPRNRVSRLDWAIAGALALLVVATRLPFRTTMLYNWDSANFALALDHFDVTRHFPHPPGYFYYVQVGRLIRGILSDANASLVAEGILFSALAVVALYFLGSAIFGRRVGIVAALLLIFSVTYWSLGTVALPYVSLAFFSTSMALFAYRSVFAGKGHVIAPSLLYAMAGGFRPDLLLFLGPLWLLCLITAYRNRRDSAERFGDTRFNRKDRKEPTWLSLRSLRPLRLANTRSGRTGGSKTSPTPTPRSVSPCLRGSIIVALLIAVGGFLLWYLPTVWLSGGFQSYHSTLLAYLQVDVAEKYSPTHRGWGALLVNIRDTLGYLFYALYFAVIPLLAGAGYLLLRPRAIDWRFAAFLVCWVGPMAAFYVFIHIGDPGYVFTILPALLLLSARMLTWRRPILRHHDEGASFRWKDVRRPPTTTPREPHTRPLSHRERVRAGLPIFVSFVSLWLATILILAGNVGLALFYPRQLTLVGIRASDDSLRQKIEYIRSDLPPTSSVLASYETYRHLQYYLPSYRAVWIDTFDPRDQAAGIPPEATQVILVDKSLQHLGLQDRGHETPAGLLLIPLKGERELIYSQNRLILK